MAVFYKLYQDNRKNSKQKGSWYGRAKRVDTVTTEQLAEEMQENCTVKRSDILAVISELVTTMRKRLQNSMAVKIDRLGTFKIGINTRPSKTVKDFKVQENVRGVHLLFQPETKVDKNGYRRRAMLTGVKVRELPKNDVKVEDKENGTVTP